MESVAAIQRREFKISIFGEAQTGKTLLIDFLKNEQLSKNLDNDQIYRLGQAPEEASNRYLPTWGMKCHEIEQEITDSVIANMQIWEAGAVFISKYPHYLEYLAQEADLIIYTISVDTSSEATGRPVGEFLSALRSTVNLARQAFEEQFADQKHKDDDSDKSHAPKELIMITGSAKYQSQSQE